MTWHDASEDTEVPTVRCIESGPEYPSGQLAGYILHMETDVNTAQLVRMLAKLWDIAGVTAVTMEDPAARSLGITIERTADPERVLRDLREALPMKTQFTGTALMRICGCGRCSTEKVAWLVLSLLDRPGREKLAELSAAFKALEPIKSIGIRGDNLLILRVDVDVISTGSADNSFPLLRAITDSVKVHLETSHASEIYALSQWVVGRNPHDW